jgi:WD40 repeat protein
LQVGGHSADGTSFHGWDYLYEENPTSGYIILLEVDRFTFVFYAITPSAVWQQFWPTFAAIVDSFSVNEDTLMARPTPTPITHRTIEIYALAFSPDGSIIATTDGYSLYMWDIENEELLFTTYLVDMHTIGSDSLVFSPNGELVAVSTGDVFIIDIESGQMTFSNVSDTFSRSDELVTAVDFSPDGSRLVTAHDGFISIWDVTNGEKVKTIQGHEDKKINAIAFTPDGNRIVSAGWDDNLRVWDSTSGAEILSIPAGQDGISVFAVSPDGKMVVTGGSNGSLCLWDLNTKEQILTVSGNYEYLNSVVFHPHANLFASLGGIDGLSKAIIWDANTGDKLLTIEVSEFASSLAFSPDGMYIAVGNMFTGNITIWNVETGEEVKVIETIIPLP